MTQITVAEAKRRYGSLYHIAKLLGVNRSTVGRWGRYVPGGYTDKLSKVPPQRLKRGRP